MQLVDDVPLPVVFLLTLAAVLLAVEAGFRLGRFRLRHADSEREAPVGTMVAATLGLFGFLLAFTFNMAASRFDAKRQVIVEEANAIGTAYLRADLVEEPHRGRIKELLREYVDVRIGAARSAAAALEGKRRSEELHQALWAETRAAAAAHPPVPATLFVQPVNEVIDLHGKRVAIALHSRIPGTIWLALYAIGMLAMSAMGYHAGLSVNRRSMAAILVAVTFSAVLWLIANLDRSQEGTLTVSQQAMTELRASMEDPPRP
jgi:hypothetical protein